MKQEDEVKKLTETVFSISSICKAISILKNSQELYLINAYDIDLRYNQECFISIPSCLVDKIKEMLIDYYKKTCNEQIKQMKQIEL